MTCQLVRLSTSGRKYPHLVVSIRIARIFSRIFCLKKLVTGRDPWESAEKMTFLDATPDAEHYVTGASHSFDSYTRDTDTHGVYKFPSWINVCSLYHLHFLQVITQILIWVSIYNHPEHYIYLFVILIQYQFFRIKSNSTTSPEGKFSPIKKALMHLYMQIVKVAHYRFNFQL